MADPKRMTGGQMQQRPSSLSSKERWDLSFCSLAWMFACSVVTLVVGNVDVIVRSIDPSVTDNRTTVPLAMFFAGVSLVSSLGYLDYLVTNDGRKFTFFIGVALSFAGTILGVTSLLVASRMVLAAATACFGAATGIALYLRFAVRTIVSLPSYATACTVAGGVGAALLGGPFLARLVQQGLLLEPSVEEEAESNNYEHMGVFLLTGVYGVAGAVCTALVDFGDAEPIAAASHTPRVSTLGMYATVLTTPSFLFPMIFSALVWSALFLPMGMAQAILSSSDVVSNGQSLMMTELNLASMFFPGWVLASFCCLRCLSYRTLCGISAVLSLSAVVCLFFAKAESAAMVFWIAGMVCLGMGWGFGFIGATDWLAKARIPGIADVQIQCAHDFFSFLVVGIAITAASLIADDVDDLSSNWSEWNVLHGVVLILLFLAVLLVVGDWLWRPDHVPKEQAQAERSSGNNTMVISSNYAVANHIRPKEGHQQKRIPSPYPISETIQSRHSLDDIEEAVKATYQSKVQVQQEDAFYDDEEEDNIVHLRPLEDSAARKTIDDDIRQRGMMGISLADESFDTESIYTDNDDDTLPPPPPPLDGDYDEAEEWSNAILNKKSYMTESTAEETGETDQHPQDEVMVARRF